MEAFQGTRPTLSLYKHQVSGKAPKMVTPDNKIILKCFVKQEELFYQYFSQLSATSVSYSLVKFLSAFHGTVNLTEKPNIQYESEGENKQIAIWLDHVKMRYDKQNQHNCFILLSNFLFGYTKPNVLDIKVGGKPKKPLKAGAKQPTPYKFKLNGMLKTDKNHEPEFISKYLLNEIRNYEQLQKNIAFFFTESSILKQVELHQILDQLVDLNFAIKANSTWKFESTSICLIYDSQCSGKAQVKFIDFGRAVNNEFTECYDEIVCSGLEYVIKMVKGICENPRPFHGLELKKKEGEVVPKQKVMKFESQDKNIVME